MDQKTANYEHSTMTEKDKKIIFGNALFIFSYFLLFSYMYVKPEIIESFVFYFIFYIPICIYIWQHRQAILQVIYVLLTFNLGLFAVTATLCKVLAETYINRMFLIETQYINHSSTLISFIFFVILSPLIILIVFSAWYTAKSIFSSVVHQVCIFKKVFHKAKNSNWQLKALDNAIKLTVTLGLMTLIIVVAAIFLDTHFDWFVSLALLADSSAVSDCGPQIEGTTYIRINKNQCYETNYSFMNEIFAGTLPEFKIISSFKD